MTACAELSSLAAEIAAEGHGPRRFLVELGRRGAGVRLGPLWVLDAARGGHNPIQGAGFLPQFDDSTRGQPRHFAGVTATATRLGIRLTRFLAVNLLGDPIDSADGRLSEAAFEFVVAIRSRRLSTLDASAWISRRLCGADLVAPIFAPQTCARPRSGSVTLMSDALSRHTDYGQVPLTEQGIAAEPLDQLKLWVEQAADGGVYEPNAMVLSTVEADGAPSSRTVLLRTVDASGLEFFTSYTSQKGRALLHDPRVSIVFPWYLIHRQVIIRGTARPVDPAVSDAYFASRPRGSQIAAAASDQSRPIASRELLEQRVRELEAQYEGGDVPRPRTWGGFRIVPESFEFWQGRSSRMHDRLRFTRNESSAWAMERLQP